MTTHRAIVINSSPQEARVALLERTALLDIFIERARSKGVAGNIYKGKVTRVLPGMQAAFVDLGLEKAAFLHVSDCYPDPANLAVNEDIDNGPLPNGEGEAARRQPIEALLKKGDEVVVQVAKEPIGGKGARVTSQISLPGRYLVYLPTTAHIGVSRRIEAERERDRLRGILASVRPPEAGLIARSFCDGITKREILADLRFLARMWSRIAHKAQTVAAPALLHYDMDLILRVIRDLFTNDVQRVVVDNPRDYQRIVSFIETAMPRLVQRVSLYEGPDPIFEHFGIEKQIGRALDRKVPLKSGGYLVIDHTEALTSIDVNTGRYVGGRSQEDTVLRTNLEAVRAIVEQLRLRNIGGLIIIDFIDMERTSNRRKLFEALREALRKDKARTNVLSISELGLVEMTRKRTRESLQQLLCTPCPHCAGTGHVKAAPTVAYEILRRVKREAARNPMVERITVKARPDVARFLTDTERRSVEQLEREIGKRVAVKPSTDLPDGEAFELVTAEVASATSA